MKEYFYQTLSVITFLSIADLIVTKTKNGKIVKTIISLISVTALSIPIISIVKNVKITNENYTLVENYNEYLLNQNSIKKALIDAEIDNFELKFEFSSSENLFKLEKIIIIFENEVINDNSEHIDMTERVNLALKNTINLSGVTIEIEAKR